MQQHRAQPAHLAVRAVRRRSAGHSGTLFFPRAAPEFEDHPVPRGEWRTIWVIMDSTITAHVTVEDFDAPRSSRQGTDHVPSSLILRLEPLRETHSRTQSDAYPTSNGQSRPQATPNSRLLQARLRPAPARQPGADSSVGRAAPAPVSDAALFMPAGSTSESDPAAPTAPVASAPASPPPASRPAPAFGSWVDRTTDSPSVAVPRRIVDVAAPERMSIATPLTRWSAAVAASHDACFVIDSNGVLISISVAAAELLGCGDTALIGRHLLDVITLVDLDTGQPNPDYAARITALTVLESPGLARSLIRVRHEDGSLVTLDTSSAPVHDVTGYPLGSVTFLAPIPRR
jgi:PAS domain S-box-containing protein